MNRLGRLIVTISAPPSAMVCGLVCAGWLRSGYRCDTVAIRRDANFVEGDLAKDPGPSQPYRYVGEVPPWKDHWRVSRLTFETARGILLLTAQRDNGAEASRPPRILWTAATDRGAVRYDGEWLAALLRGQEADIVTRVWLAIPGLRVYRAGRSGLNKTVVVVRAWWLAATAAASPGVWFFGRCLERHRRARGRCRRCGYDLRATPDRCPECGTAGDVRTRSGGEEVPDWVIDRWRNRRVNPRRVRRGLRIGSEISSRFGIDRKSRARRVLPQ